MPATNWTWAYFMKESEHDVNTECSKRWMKEGFSPKMARNYETGSAKN